MAKQSNISNTEGANRMDAKMLVSEGLDLTIDIEELEQKIAPDGGETVLGLPLPKKPHR